MRSPVPGKSKPRPSCSSSYHAAPMPRIGAAVRDHVERRHDLGEQRGVAVRDAGDERAELHPLGARGERAEQRVRLEDRFVGAAERGQLPEVVHHPHRLEAARLGRDRVRAHVVEHRRVGRRRRAGSWGSAGRSSSRAHAIPGPAVGDRRDGVREVAQPAAAQRLDLDDAAAVVTKVTPVSRPWRTDDHVVELLDRQARADTRWAGRGRTTSATRSGAGR